MIEVKFHKGISKIYGVSKKDFAEATKEKYPYLQVSKNGKEAFGICPLCENPVKLLGVYTKLEKQNNHARHYKHNVRDLADFSEYTYLHCPYHRKKADYLREIRRNEDITDFNKEVLKLAHDYLHICIYIISKITGMVITTKLAEEIAYDYSIHPGYMTYDITRENVPYIMGTCMTGKNLVKRIIEENSPLYDILKNKKEIYLELLPKKSKNPKNLYRITSRKGYLQLSFNISNYRFSVSDTSQLREYLKLHIGIPDGTGTYDTYATKEIEVDPFLFSRLINSSEKFSYLSEDIRKIADKYLVLPEN